MTFILTSKILETCNVNDATSEFAIAVSKISLNDAVALLTARLAGTCQTTELQLHQLIQQTLTSLNSTAHWISSSYLLQMMADQEHGGSQVAKRRKLNHESTVDTTASSSLGPQEAGKGLKRPISPPPARRLKSCTPTPSTPRVKADAHGPHIKQTPQASTAATKSSKSQSNTSKATQYVSSPFQLTRIRDLAPHQNVDAVGLGDILGDPMIKECWNFNFLFDVDFVM
jgi:hypothetical protein